MNELSKADFLEVIDQSILDKSIKFLAVAIDGVGVEEELIVNHRNNFEGKREYWDKTYNENMEMVHNKNIKITFVAGVESLSELEYVTRSNTGNGVDY